MNQANIAKLVFTIGRLIDGQQIYPLPDKKKDRYDEIIDFEHLCPLYEKYRDNATWVDFRTNKLQSLAMRWNKEIIEYIKERELALQQQRAESGEQFSSSDEHKKSDSSDGNLQPHHQQLDKSNQNNSGGNNNNNGGGDDTEDKDKEKKDSSDDSDQLYGDNEDLGMLIK